MKRLRTLWNELPIYAQVPLACVVGPLVLVGVVVLTILSIIPMAMWHLVDEIIN